MNKRVMRVVNQDILIEVQNELYRRPNKFMGFVFTKYIIERISRSDGSNIKARKPNLQN